MYVLILSFIDDEFLYRYENRPDLYFVHTHIHLYILYMHIYMHTTYVYVCVYVWFSRIYILAFLNQHIYVDDHMHWVKTLPTKTR